MIVDRRTFIYKRGRRNDAVAVLKEMLQLATSKFKGLTGRIYTPSIGPFDTLAMEGEYESLAEYERIQAEFFALPEVALLMEKWLEATETGGTHEIWDLEE